MRIMTKALMVAATLVLALSLAAPVDASCGTQPGEQEPGETELFYEKRRRHEDSE